MTIFIYYYVGLFSVVSGMMAFVLNRKHFLSTLLSLEFIMVSIFWLMSMSFFCVGVEGYFVLFFLTFTACEGALGLSLLVYLVRSSGGDFFSSFSVL
uniref:NADH-ubiquinone oxidoreductase chain 4L n=1 Tax=Stenopus hispidus TaxID=6815 RepID=I6N115_STEHS|nr:NADH dehydrogenase subunit 4L [Stenopus hispidus]AEO18309.1 NADH dehydrogenase subunit 4L [Stenopus hispidus]AGA56098.1 NADH dehydrogenase subunit 4L [Stenopus hispidus]